MSCTRKSWSVKLLGLMMAATFGVAVPAVATPKIHSAPVTNTKPDTTHCQDKTAPPKAIDASEVPKPGETSPQPVPLPATPAGGPRMAECGYVLPDGGPKLPPKLGFESWVLMDLDSGAVLAAKDPHARQRPASIIKTLLAIVVLRDLKMNTVVTGTQDDANAEGTKVGIGPGGKYTVQTLLTGLLLKSGNDIAHALAMQLGGVQQTVDKMNATAQTLGAVDTRTATPSGLDGPGMSTSSYDMALIFHKAMSDSRFAKIVGTKKMTFPGFGKSKPFAVENDNHLLGTYPGDLGGKTGFTDDAQHTYLNAAARDGKRVGLVMMRGENHLEGMYMNAPALMDYGFAIEGAHVQPVGQLVNPAPPTPPASSVGPQGSPKPAAQQDQDQSSSSTIWIVVGVLVVIVVVLLVVLWIRRKRASAD